MADPKVEIQIKAKDQASTAMKNVSGNIQGMSKQFKMAGMAMMAAGGAIAAGLGLAIKKFAQAGDEVQKMALRTGFSTEALSELKHALEISGAGLSLMDTATKKMSKTIIDASDGLETYVRTFDKIGMSAEELMEMKPEEQFMKIAMAIAELESHTVKAAVAQDVFGRGGLQMLPLLAEGADGIARLRQEAHALGIVFSQEAANAAAELTDALHRMKEATTGIQMTIGEALAPAITSLAEGLKNITIKFQDLNPAMQKLIVFATAGGAALLILGGGMFLILGFLPQILIGFKAVQGFIATRLLPTLLALKISLGVIVAEVALLTAGLAMLGFGIYQLEKYRRVQEQHARLEELRIAMGRKRGEQLEYETKALVGLAMIDADHLRHLQLEERAYGDLRQEYDALLQEYNEGIKTLEKQDAIINSLTGTHDEYSDMAAELATEGVEGWEKQTVAVEGYQGALEGITQATQLLTEEEKRRVTGWGAFISTYESLLGISVEFASAYGSIMRLFGGVMGAPRGFLGRVMQAHLTGLVGAAVGEGPMAIGGPAYPGQTFQYGGIVQGAPGQPVPILAHGGEMFLGERGLHITVPIYLDSELITERVIDHAGKIIRMQGR